jgi:type IV pilus assembly protein PilY1
MSINNRRLRSTWISAAVAGLTAFSGSNALLAAPLDISDVPLFLTSGVQPNLMMAIDDSGSMDFEVLFPGNDGSAWWRTNVASGGCTAATGRSFIGCISDGTTDVAAAGRLNFNNGGTHQNPAGTNFVWRKYSYLFPNGCDSGDDSFRRRLCDGAVDHFAIPPLPAFAWSRSAAHNSAYFNPAVTYLPWRNGGGYTFANASPTAARFDPVFGAATDALNLTLDRGGHVSAATGAACSDGTFGTPNDNHLFKVQTGMVIPAGTCIRNKDAPSGNNFTVWATTSTSITVGVTTGNNAIGDGHRLAIRYYPATFYLPSTTALPAGFGYTATPLSATAPNGTAMRGYQIKLGNFSSAATYNAAIQNFANWFTYYRKRHQALRAGLGDAFGDLSGMRVGGFTINDIDNAVELKEIDVPANRTDLYTQFYSEWVQSGGTPNRDAVAALVENYKRDGDGAPVQHACQRNFGMLFTDGFSNPPANGDGFDDIGNIDGGRGAPFQDSVDDTMADGVMSAYVDNIRPDLDEDKVKVPQECNAENVDPWVDCNNDPHMNFYAVTLNTRGLQFNPDASPAQDPFTTAPTWPTTFPARHPSAVDDLWHATINGRGRLLNAKSPQEIAEKLRSVLTNIEEQEGSAASASLNSGSIRDGTMLFQAKFDSRDWAGGLLAYSINDDGTIGDLEWNAADELPLPASRQIVTIGSDDPLTEEIERTPIPFRWANIGADTVRSGELDAVAATAQLRLNYLRGDATNEGLGATNFRVRSKKLGDIVSSAPIFVGAPRFAYKDTLETEPYSEFRANNAERDPVVYVGANDGMVHAFSATPDGGDELFAFIPSPLFKNLKRLSERNYTHRFYVDGSPNSGDVFINGEWRTVLIGGLNGGGQGIYALDITNPDALTEANAEDVVLWEFTDADDADLGYTYSQPAIVRLKNGKWAAIFGNGYNNTEPDDHISATGQGALYVVDIETGALIRRLDTNWGAANDPTGASRPNGLATPAAVDVNNDAIIDFVYAGDLYGNLWKVDLRSTDPAEWKFSFGTEESPLPFFELDPNDADTPDQLQPITSRPEVIRGRRGVGMMVLFGTGKYMETNDKNVNTEDPDVQAHYGLFDRNFHEDGVQDDADRVTLLSQLTQQEILEEITVNGIEYRVTSHNPPAEGATKGWYMNLVSPDGFQGERQVSNTLVRNKRVIFTTLIPDIDPCGAGGSSWLMELDAYTGTRLNETPFDVAGPTGDDGSNNRDGRFNNDDFVDDPQGDGKVAVGGTKLPVGISPTSGVLYSADGRTEYKYNPGTSGAIAVTKENPGEKVSGRQSWRQVR